MSGLKNLSEIIQMDKSHESMATLTGLIPSLEGMHKVLSSYKLHSNVPLDVQKQFDVARNMALYSYFYYALAPEVHHKTYTVIEMALRIKASSNERLMLKALLKKAVDENWISDFGFRHLPNPTEENLYCKRLIDVMPRLRNNHAHGTNMLFQNCLEHVMIATDLINQLFE